jgi:hypothetical protein
MFKYSNRYAANVIIIYTYFRTGEAGELPAIWSRDSSREGTLASPGSPGAGVILESRTFTYRPACCLTK